MCSHGGQTGTPVQTRRVTARCSVDDGGGGWGGHVTMTNIGAAFVSQPAAVCHVTLQRPCWELKFL